MFGNDPLHGLAFGQPVQPQHREAHADQRQHEQQPIGSCPDTTASVHLISSVTITATAAPAALPINAPANAVHTPKPYDGAPTPLLCRRLR